MNQAAANNNLLGFNQVDDVCQDYSKVYSELFPEFFVKHIAGPGSVFRSNRVITARPEKLRAAGFFFNNSIGLLVNDHLAELVSRVKTAGHDLTVQEPAGANAGAKSQHKN